MFVMVSSCLVSYFSNSNSCIVVKNVSTYPYRYVLNHNTRIRISISDNYLNLTTTHSILLELFLFILICFMVEWSINSILILIYR